MRSGDTLLGIALRYDLTWQALADANDLTATSFLQIGQELAVPAAAADASASTTTSAVGSKQSFSLARVHTVDLAIRSLALPSNTMWTWQRCSRRTD